MLKSKLFPWSSLEVTKDLKSVLHASVEINPLILPMFLR